jgi:hypothetical protein
VPLAYPIRKSTQNATRYGFLIEASTAIAT